MANNNNSEEAINFYKNNFVSCPEWKKNILNWLDVAAELGFLGEWPLLTAGSCDLSEQTLLII